MLLGNAYDPDPRVRAEALALRDGGLSVTILAWDRDGGLRADERADGIDVLRVGPRSTHGRGRGQSFFAPAFWARAAKRARRLAYDLLWCHDLDTLPAGALLAWHAGVPVVFDAHESYPDMVEDSVGPALTGALRWLERHLVRRVSAVVTVGERLSSHFRRMGARRTVVAGNWKDPEEYRHAALERERIRERHRIPSDAWLVTFVGWLSPERRIPELIDAVQGLDDAFLFIGGRGPLEGVCREAADRCARIRFAGWVNPGDVAAVTAAGDAVYYGFDPGNGNAAFSAPNKLFEAMAAGVPVVTGPFGEIEDVVREHRCGVVLPDYRPESVREGLRRARAVGEFRGGCRAAAAVYSRERADRAVRSLAADLLCAAECAR